MTDFFKKKIAIKSEQEMTNLAIELASLAKVGDVLLLDGDLGSGKSFFSRAFINHLAQQQVGKQINVPSPTFTLMQIYDQLNPAVWHFDLYRLSNSDEAYELGLDDAVKNGICLIEWPSRLADDLPHNCLTIQFKHDTIDSRKVELIINSQWKKRLNHLF